jgi:hypothetical protein
VRRLTLGLGLLRGAGLASLVLLLWNPSFWRAGAGREPPLVLLDASLSMAGREGGQRPWRAAVDSARALARSGGVIWRFGDRVVAFDSTPPADGASRLGPALEAAAARGGPVDIVTDGEISDADQLSPDLLRRAKVVVLARPALFDAFVAGIEGPRRVMAGDTIRLKVSYGTAGMRDAGRGMRGTIVVSAEGHRLASRPVTLPDSGVLSADLTLPASRLTHPGWTALEARLDGVGDSEPRDDARLFVMEVSAQPAAVVLASPPTWESRFLSRTLADVARLPLRTFVEAEPGRWRDAATLAPVSTADVSRAARQARLTAFVGDVSRMPPLPSAGGVLVWPTAGGRDGDWYVAGAPPSPLAGDLAGIPWDSLPPATAVIDLPADSAAVVVLDVKLARRGPARPIVTLSERDRRRRVTVGATGLWRWDFRGGASAEAYRTLVAVLTDWLLGGGEGRGERFAPVKYEAAHGLPVFWRWLGRGAPQDVVLSVSGPSPDRARSDTLHFDADGRAELRLAPGVYRYTAAGGSERGLVAVETYSDEWRPTVRALTAQPGLDAARPAVIALRDRWWLFVIAIAAFTAEWAWRRRQGLP